MAVMANGEPVELKKSKKEHMEKLLRNQEEVKQIIKPYGPAAKYRQVLPDLHKAQRVVSEPTFYKYRDQLFHPKPEVGEAKPGEPVKGLPIPGQQVDYYPDEPAKGKPHPPTKEEVDEAIRKTEGAGTPLPAPKQKRKYTRKAVPVLAPASVPAEAPKQKKYVKPLEPALGQTLVKIDDVVALFVLTRALGGDKVVQHLLNTFAEE